MQVKRERETGVRSPKIGMPQPEREAVGGSMFVPKKGQRAWSLGLKAFTMVLFFLFSLVVPAQKKSETIVTIGNVKVSSDEFEANYLKNNANI